MPIMTVKTFEERTSIAFAMRGKKLQMIASRLGGYIQNPSNDNLEMLWTQLCLWQSPHQTDVDDRDSWMADRRNKKSAISELTNWVARKRIEPAILAFKRAAKEVHTAYGAFMETQYSKALHDIFINSEVDSTQPLTSLVYWQQATHWTQRLQAVPGWAASQGNTTGFTDTWDPAKINAVFLRRQPGANIADPNPPLNRIIEVGVLEDSTVFHELLHWVTHHDFKTRFDQLGDVNLRKYIVEGGTEFLTRKGRGDWAHGGYIDLISIWQDMMKDNSVVTFQDFAKAYFKGVGVDAVHDAIKTYTTKGKLYQDAVKASFTAQIKAWAAAGTP